MKGRKREEEVKAKRETEERKEGKGSNVEAQGKTKKGGTKGEEGDISRDKLVCPPRPHRHSPAYKVREPCVGSSQT